MHGPDKNGHVTNQQLGRTGERDSKKWGGRKMGDLTKDNFFNF